MNKKVLTLCAGFLLAGSLTAVAQYCPQNGEVDYRTRLVKAAALDATFQDVKKINQEYYYQLEVDKNTLPLTQEQAKNDVTYVLSVERDYSTGKLYLTAQPITKTTLTHSLWKIKVTDRSANGRVYSYINKETGFELTFDHTNALQIDPDSEAKNKIITVPESYDPNGKNNANVGWDYENNGLMDGCTSNWAWYTTDDVTGNDPFDYKRIYSYFHNQTDSVMTLAAISNDPNNILGKNFIYEPQVGSGIRKVTDGLAEDGLNGNATTGFAIVAIKDSKFGANDYIKSLETYPLAIRPVVAGAKVLNADEINSMIDADGSYLAFGKNSSNHIANYEEWDDADNSGKGGFAKFTVLKPGTNEELNIVEGANPFAHIIKEGKFVAEPSAYDVLRRTNYNAEQKGLDAQSSAKGNAFAGYDILLRTSDPKEEVGDKKLFDYLSVSEYTYEDGTPNGNHNGLKVENAPYAYIKSNAGKPEAERVTVWNDKASATAKAATTKATVGTPDALEARYHWKATYYATNDSLVLEPLNASRMNQAELRDKTPFEQTHLATAWSHQWVNTVNKAAAYNGSNEELPGDNPGAGSNSYKQQGNSMYNKAAGVPVALYAMNNSQVGDSDQLLTVGSGSGKDVNASMSKWAAVCKFVAKGDNPAYVTNKKGSEYQAEMNLRLAFNHDYRTLTRATVESGLYFMNIVDVKPATGQTEHRVEGAYIVEDMKGHVVYDILEEGQQDFTHMPATQWVVEQQPCLEGDDVNNNDNPVVKIWNREFNGLAGSMKPVFDGQLYTAGDGKLFTIDHRHYAFNKQIQTVDKHYQRDVINCADLIKFTAVDPQTTLGYFNATEDELRNNVYMFQHMYDMSAAKFLSVGEDNLLKLGDEGTAFELFRSEGWVPVPDTTEYVDDAGKVQVKIGDTYSFKYEDEQTYGYASELANVQRLDRTFYKIKVQDANNIDNDHKFIAIDNQHKYVIATEEEIANPENHLTFAIVLLKENNDLGNNQHGYAIVNAPAYVQVTAGSAADLTGLSVGVSEPDEFGDTYVFYYKNKDGKDGYNKDEDVIMVRRTLSTEQVDGKLAVEAVSLDTKIADLCETTTDAFALVPAENRLYRDLNEAYAGLVNNDKKVINIMGIDEQSNEFLFEDIKNGMNYLGIENKSDLTTDEGFYVDAVAKSMNTTMPQYLFVVAADSVPAYTYCDCDIHNVKHGINSGCEHSEDYAGYVEGRFLVNFNDSVHNAMINKLTNADKFKSNGYTRLGFVEAVHRGDNLYVLKAPYTLESIKEVAADGSGDKIINPLFLSADSLGKVYDIVPLDGKHNNVAFSLRNVGDDADSFMLESNDMYTGGKGYSQVGSFAGAWVKIINGVPVLAKYSNANGNHNTGDTTDSWFEAGDYTDLDETTGEFINQGARFTFEVLDKDASATANEEITADATVSVVATDGAVIVKGAEGKNVIVSTILGKVVANEVVNSDNETIAAPAGIVVVSVDGESFKVAVK